MPVFRHCAQGRRMDGVGGAGVLGDLAGVGHRLRREQLQDVRCTDRLLVGGAEPHVADRRPFAPDLVGVGLDAGGIVREPVAELQVQVLGVGHVLQDRHARLAIAFRDTDAGVDRRRGAAGAGQVVVELGLVGRELQVLAPLLEADGHADPVVGPGRLDPVVAEIAGDRALHDPLADAAAGAAVDGQEVQGLLGDAAVLEDVVGHARTAGDADRAGWSLDYLQRPLQLRDAQVVLRTAGRAWCNSTSRRGRTSRTR